MATPHQKRMYQLHRQVCKREQVGQSTLKHRTLSGQLSPPSPTGVITYTPPMPLGADEVTTDTLIWAIWQQKIPKTSAADDIEPGRTMFIDILVRFPAIDDTGAVITVADEDYLVNSQGERFKIQNPSYDHGIGYITAQLERLR